MSLEFQKYNLKRRKSKENNQEKNNSGLVAIESKIISDLNKKHNNEHSCQSSEIYIPFWIDKFIDKYYAKPSSIDPNIEALTPPQWMGSFCNKNGYTYKGTEYENKCIGFYFSIVEKVDKMGKELLKKLCAADDIIKKKEILLRSCVKTGIDYAIVKYAKDNLRYKRNLKEKIFKYRAPEILLKELLYYTKNDRLPDGHTLNQLIIEIVDTQRKNHQEIAYKRVGHIKEALEKQNLWPGNKYKKLCKIYLSLLRLYFSIDEVYYCVKTRSYNELERLYDKEKIHYLLKIDPQFRNNDNYITHYSMHHLRDLLYYFPKSIREDFVIPYASNREFNHSKYTFTDSSFYKSKDINDSLVLLYKKVLFSYMLILPESIKKFENKA